MTSIPPSLLLTRFVCKNNGVLFENQLLQIGIKSEYRQNLGMFAHTCLYACGLKACSIKHIYRISQAYVS